MSAPTDETTAHDALILEVMLSPEGRADPYPRYRALREAAPLHRSAFGPLFLTRYEDSRAMLRDNRFGKGDDEELTEEELAANPFFAGRRERRRDDSVAKSMLNLDPPDHTRLRGLVSRGFTPRRVEELRPAVEVMTDAALDDLAAAGEADLLDVLGFPLPVRVIGELVGVPEADRDRFRGLVRAAATALEPGISDEQWDEAAEALGEMREYFAALIAARRLDPRDDLVSALIPAGDDDDRLTEDEMVITLILIFAAGFETTTNLIGNGVLTLLQHPAELARLRADRSLVPAAVEEVLRYQSPVQVDARRALVDAEIAGERVAEGEWVITFLGAANRDPAVYDDPETFRIVARDTPILSFASGIHHCLGASLARLEGRVVLDRLLDRFERVELVDAQPEWRNTLVLRGLTKLPVRVG